MKKITCIILACIMLFACLGGCGSYKNPPKGGFIVLEHFTGYKLGIVKNQIDADVVREKIEDPVIVTCKSVDDGLNALRNREIHGLVLPAIYANKAVKDSFDFEKLMDTFEKKELRVVSLNTSELILPIDAAITKIKNNGTLDKIAASHISDAEENDAYSSPADYEKAEGRKITVGLSSESAFPYTYRDTNGSIVGINVDVAREIAADFLAELVIKEYPEKKLSEALDNGEVDFIMSQFSIDEDAPKTHVYSDPYFDASTLIIIRSPLADIGADK